MEHRHRSRRRGRSPKRLQPILRLSLGQALDDRDRRSGPPAEHDPQEREDHVAAAQPWRNVVCQAQDDSRAALIGPVQPGIRDAPDDGRGDVDEVAVSVRPRPEHRVAEGDGIRLAPGDLLPERGAHLRLIGRTGPRRNGAHTLVRHHLSVRLPCPIGGDSPLAPVMFVESTDVERSRYRNLCAEVCQPFSKLQPGLSDINRAVDVRAADIQQLLSASHLCHARHNGHGHLRCRSMVAA